jgi:hypothetical protein
MGSDASRRYPARKRRLLPDPRCRGDVQKHEFLRSSGWAYASRQAHRSSGWACAGRQALVASNEKVHSMETHIHTVKLLLMVLAVVFIPGCKNTSKDVACRQNKACMEYGRCFSSGPYGQQACVAKTKEDCAASTIRCGDFGQCGLGPAGECVAISHPDCRKSVNCKKEGLCSRKGIACIATRAEDCRHSDNCKTLHQCYLGAEGCYNQFQRN